MPVCAELASRRMDWPIDEVVRRSTMQVSAWSCRTGMPLQQPVVAPLTWQVVAMQQTPLLQAASPSQVTSQVWADDLQRTRASHAEPPSQRMPQ
jgi:hypothetical protein